MWQVSARNGINFHKVKCSICRAWCQLIMMEVSGVPLVSSVNDTPLSEDKVIDHQPFLHNAGLLWTNDAYDCHL